MFFILASIYSRDIEKNIMRSRSGKSYIIQYLNCTIKYFYIWQAKQSVALSVADAKTGCGRSSVRPWKNTFGQPQSNSGKPSDDWRGKQCSTHTAHSCSGTLLTSTETIVRQWKEQFHRSLKSLSHIFCNRGILWGRDDFSTISC